MAKTSEEQWTKVKALYEKGESLRDISDEVGIPYKTIDNRAKKNKWGKGILAQHIADSIRVREEFGTLELAQQVVVAQAVDEAVQRMEWLNKANMTVANLTMRKLAIDKEAASYQDLNAASTTLGRTKDNVFGKTPDTAIQINNTALPRTINVIAGRS